MLVLYGEIRPLIVSSQHLQIHIEEGFAGQEREHVLEVNRVMTVYLNCGSFSGFLVLGRSCQ